MIINSSDVFDENIISQIADCKFFRCTREHLIELFNISNSVHVDKWAWEKFEQLIEYNLPIIGLSKNDDLIGFVTYLACLEEARILNVAVLKEFQNKDAIAKRLGISTKRAAEILEFLISIGLARYQDGGYVVGTARMHLGSDSSM
ncbi:MAG TPA: hypothetical protein PKD00_07860, partial [Burkholderiales bacterium]|nr:hypothetical protein [Burkholderiales bacterium]